MDGRDDVRGWFFGNLERLGNLSSADALRDLLLISIAQVGFDCIACGELDFQSPRRGVFFMNTWPQAYFDLYRREGAMEFDPLLRKLRETSEAFSWSDLVIRNPRENWLWKTALEFGWRDGLAIPIPRGGQRFGLVSLASRSQVPVGEPRRYIIAFVSLAYERLRGLMNGQDFVADNAGLTPREIECLSHVAQGLSDKKIADACGIASDTVHEHVESAKRKLGARTRPQAIAIATGLCLLRRFSFFPAVALSLFAMT